MTQTNTQAGDVLRKPHNNVPGPLPSNGLDLAGRLFVQRTFAGTDNKDYVSLAGSPAVLPHFVCTEGAWGDKHITVRPLSTTQPVRVRLKGTCNRATAWKPSRPPRGPMSAMPVRRRARSVNTACSASPRSSAWTVSWC